MSRFWGLAGFALGKSVRESLDRQRELARQLELPTKTLPVPEKPRAFLTCPVCGAPVDSQAYENEETGHTVSVFVCWLGRGYHYALWRLRIHVYVRRLLLQERQDLMRLYPDSAADVKAASRDFPMG